MTQVTKLMLTTIRPEIEAALKAVAEKYQLTITTGKCTYSVDGGHFTMALEAVAAGGKTKEQERYESAMFLGLPEFGTTFHQNGHEYATSGINTTGSQILATRKSDGKVYQWKTDGLIALIARQQTQAKTK